MSINQCDAPFPAGINKDCGVPIKSVKSIIITDASVTFADTNAMLNLSTWKSVIQVNGTGYVPLGLRGYEPTTDEPTINTDTFGQKTFVRPGIPSGIFRIDSNSCDWNHMSQTAVSKMYRVWFILEGGSLEGWMDSVGVIRGFLAEVTAVATGLPVADTIENGFPLFINFKSYEEFTNVVIQKPTWNAITELPLAMPTGVAIKHVGAFDIPTSTQNINLFERCGDAITGAVVADFEVITALSNVSTPIISIVTDNGDGNYDIEFQKSAAPEDLVAGDYITYRYKKVVSTVITAISNNSTAQA